MIIVIKPDLLKCNAVQASFEILRDFILDAYTFLQAFFREVASGLAMAGRPRFEGITAEQKIKL